MAKVEWKSDVTKIDKGVKNPWRWAWLEKIIDKTQLSTVIEKVNKPGFALCKICRKEINYGKRGSVALDDHVSGAKHKQLVHIQKTNYALPGTYLILS